MNAGCLTRLFNFIKCRLRFRVENIAPDCIEQRNVLWYDTNAAAQRANSEVIDVTIIDED